MKLINSFYLLVYLSIHFLPINAFTFPSFHEGMQADNTYQAAFVKAAHWGKCKELYDTYVNNYTYHEIPLIPKIIHQIWLGSPFPQKYVKYQQSWQKYHPTWQYRLWTEQEIKKLGLVNQALYDKAKNWGEKSDIARYEILYRFGGLYVDTDFECLHSFDQFHHTCCFFVGLLWPRTPEHFNIANGLMGSCPGHPLLKECIYTMRPSNDISPMGIIDRTGPYHLARCFKRLLLDNMLPEYSVGLPVNFFYAFPAWHRFEQNEEVIRAWLKEYSFAIHYWDASWT